MVRRKFELTCKMREDLMEAYREVYTKCRTQREAYEKTVTHPAPRFYVTPNQAYDMLRQMVMGDTSKIEKLSPKILWFICQFLVSQPASEFYISADTFKDIFPSLKKYGKNYHFEDIRSRRKNKELKG